METLAHLIQYLAINLEAHRHFIYLASALVAAFCAMVMLIPRYDAVAVGKWVKYFGWAFALFGAQYLLRWVIVSFNFTGRTPATANIIFTLLSDGNTILFVASALCLLDKHRLWHRLRWWVLGLAIATIISWLGGDSWYARLPDALLASLCLGLVGYATSINIRFRRHHLISVGAIIVAVIYCLLIIIYGLHPAIAAADWATNLLGSSDFKTKLIRLDTLIFSAALLLKFLQFAPAYLLLSLSLTASSEIREHLRKIAETRMPYLAPSSIVKAIHDILQAQRVELFIKVPGQKLQRVAAFAWPPHAVRQGNQIDQALIIERQQWSESLKKMLEREATVKTHPREHYSKIPLRLLETSSQGRSVMIRILMHGGIIGSLRVEIESKGVFTYSAIQQIKSLTETLSTAAQSYRELASMDQANSRFARLKVEDKEHNSQWAVENITDILHDILSPLATGLRVNLGFQERFKAYGDGSPSQYEVEERVSHQKSPPSWRTNSDEYGLYEEELLAPQDIPMGIFVMATSPVSDAPAHPSLGTSYLHRKAICKIAVSTLLDLVFNHHSFILKEFGVRVSAENASVDKWFEAVTQATRDAELLWAAVIQPSTDDDDQAEMMGEPEAVALVQHVRQTQTANLASQPIFHYRLPEPEGETHHIIALKLLNSKRELWLGISRADFGLELEFESPWKIFLAHLSELADSALYRILEDTEFRRLQIAAANDQALATVAVTTGTLAHQLVNMVRDQVTAASSLSDAFYYGQLQQTASAEVDCEKLVASMKASGERMYELTQSLTNVTKIDDRRPCRLMDAAIHAQTLFKISLERGVIRFEPDFSPDYVVDVPFYIAALTFANLVSNAAYAIKQANYLPANNHVIRITAEESGEFVICQITDTGPGVPEELRARIFDLGITTKKNNGNSAGITAKKSNGNSGGWGLYLVKRSLRENGCSIWLSNGNAGQCTFTIKFPKPNKE